MPLGLWDIIDRCPTTRTWKTTSVHPEPDPAGLRDRALLLLGFIAALRRSELSGLSSPCPSPGGTGIGRRELRTKLGQRRSYTVYAAGDVSGRFACQEQRVPGAWMKTAYVANPVLK